MPKTRPPYPPEFREKIIALHASGRSIKSLARDFEPSEPTIRGWVKQAKRTASSTHETPTADPHDEVRRLRRRVSQLEMEREILEKAAAWFAQKTVPTSRSDS